MNNVVLLQRVRSSAALEDTSSEWNDFNILREVNDAQQQGYERGIVASKQGYWVKRLIVPIVVGTAQYRMPARACTGGLLKLQIAYDATQDWQDLGEVNENLAPNYELPLNQIGTVRRFVMRGDQITLLPTPDGTNAFLRLHYYLRPSMITPVQTIVSLNPAGFITAVNVGARTITVNSMPQGFTDDGTSSGLGTAISSGVTLIDVVGGSGWHEVQLINEPQTFSGTTITCTGTGDMSTIRVGDFVRVAEQTDFPTLPDEFHRTLADTAAANICNYRSMFDKEADLRQKIAPDLARFGDLLKPRVQTSGEAIVMPISPYRGTRPGQAWPVKFP